MSMKNSISTIALLLMLICNLVACDGFYVGREAVAEPKGDSEEMASPIRLKNTEFTPLELYTDGTEEFFSENELICISEVAETPNKYVVKVLCKDFDRSMTDVSFIVREGTEIFNVGIGTLIPNCRKMIIFPRNKCGTFQVLSASWKAADIELGNEKEFGGVIRLVGYNTLEYLSFSHIFVYDKRDCIIGEYYLNGIGSEVLNQGACYYRKVIK